MMRIRRLLPDVAETTIADQAAALDFTSMAAEDRPYLYTNFALTLDGSATIGGRSGRIGTESDTAMLVALRTRADAVMIGAGTMRAEGYGRVIGDPAKRERREQEGFAPDPLMVIVSGRLDLPWDAPLFTEGAGRIVIFTASDMDPPGTETPVDVVRHTDAVDLTDAMAHLRADEGIRSLLCEGGPRLHAQLIDAGLVDELFVTHAPKLSGGTGPGMVVGLPEAERRLDLAWLMCDDESGVLFARYRVPR
jgi:riboflavin-specific deaminase-like protein